MSSKACLKALLSSPSISLETEKQKLLKLKVYISECGLSDLKSYPPQVGSGFLILAAYTMMKFHRTYSDEALLEALDYVLPSTHLMKAILDYLTEPELTNRMDKSQKLYLCKALRILCHGLPANPSSGELTENDIQTLLTRLKDIQIVKDLNWSTQTIEAKDLVSDDSHSSLTSVAISHTEVNIFTKLSQLKPKEVPLPKMETGSSIQAATAANKSRNFKRLSLNLPFVDDVPESPDVSSKKVSNGVAFNTGWKGQGAIAAASAHISVLSANQIAFARCGGADRILRLLESTSLMRDFVGSEEKERTPVSLPKDTDGSAFLRLHLQGGRFYLEELRLADACLAVLDFESASDGVWATPGRVAYAALRLATSAMACYAIDMSAGREQLAQESIALLQTEDFTSVVLKIVATSRYILSTSRRFPDHYGGIVVLFEQLDDLISWKVLGSNIDRYRMPSGMLLSSLDLNIAQLVFEGFSHACGLLKKTGNTIDALLLEKDHVMLMEVALLACKQILRSEALSKSSLSTVTEGAVAASTLAASSVLWEQWLEISHYLTKRLLGDFAKKSDEEESGVEATDGTKHEKESCAQFEGVKKKKRRLHSHPSEVDMDASDSTITGLAPSDDGESTYDSDDSTYGVRRLFAEPGEVETKDADDDDAEEEEGKDKSSSVPTRQMTLRLNSLSEFRLEDTQMGGFLRDLYALLLNTMTTFMEEQTDVVRSAITDVCVSHILSLLRTADKFVESRDKTSTSSPNEPEQGENVETTLLDYLHRLVTRLVERELLDERRSRMLLRDLGLPIGTTEEGQWPLHIPPFTLSLFGQLCLFNLQKERSAKQDAKSTDVSPVAESHTIFLRRWLEALTQRCFEPQVSGPVFNLTEAQIFLVLFHTLPTLSQRKLVFSQLCQALNTVSGRLHAPLHAVAVSRLLLLLAYMLHHFFEPPDHLFPEVQPILFSPSAPPTQSIYASVDCHQLYRLTDRPSDAPGRQDGMALKHLLTRDYGRFLDCLFQVVDASLACELPSEPARFTEYQFRVCWDVLSALPPSIELVESLGTESSVDSSCSRLLCLSLLTLRMVQPKHAEWVREQLSRLEPNFGEVHATQLRQRLTLEALTTCLGQFCATWMRPGGPPDLVPSVVVHAVTSWMHVLTCVALEGGKEKESGGGVVVPLVSGSGEEVTKMADAATDLALQLLEHVVDLCHGWFFDMRPQLGGQVEDDDDDDDDKEEKKRDQREEEEEERLGAEEWRPLYEVILSLVGCSQVQDSLDLRVALLHRNPRWMERAYTLWRRVVPASQHKAELASWMTTPETYLRQAASQLLSLCGSHAGRAASVQTMSHSPPPPPPPHPPRTTLTTPAPPAPPSLNAWLRSLLVLRRLVSTLLSRLQVLARRCSEAKRERVRGALLPLYFDVVMEDDQNLLVDVLEEAGAPSSDSGPFTALIKGHQLRLLIRLMSLPAAGKLSNMDGVLEEAVRVMTELISSSPHHLPAFKMVFIDEAVKLQSNRVLDFFVSMTQSGRSLVYSYHVLHFFNEVINSSPAISRASQSSGTSSSLQPEGDMASFALDFCKQLNNGLLMSSHVDLDAWLTRLVSPHSSAPVSPALVQARQELTVLADRVVVRGGLSDVPLRLLECLVRLESASLLECRGAADLVAIMVSLAGGCTGASGHLVLAQKAIEWSRLLAEKLCERFKSEQEERMEEMDEEEKERLIVPASETLCSLLTYITGLCYVLRAGGEEDGEALSPLDTWPDNSGMDETLDDGHHDHQTPAEDSSDAEDAWDGEEGNELNNKLCTFTLTEREFVPQHWYHCHTCGMVNGEGVCTTCAKVCHRGHDLTYSKHGSFFCDCGAKEDGSCKAIRQRRPGDDGAVPVGGHPSTATSSTTREIINETSKSEPRTLTQTKKASSPLFSGLRIARDDLQRQLGSDSDRETLRAVLLSSQLPQELVSLLKSFLPELGQRYERVSAGCAHRLSAALSRLHRLEKKVESMDKDEQSMVDWDVIKPSFTTVCGGLQAQKPAISEGPTPRYPAPDSPLPGLPSTWMNVGGAARTLPFPPAPNQPTNAGGTRGNRATQNTDTILETARLTMHTDVGTHIRQLLNSRAVHRVSLAVMRLNGGRKQFLVSAHEKSRLTVLSMSALVRGLAASPQPAPIVKSGAQSPMISTNNSGSQNSSANGGNQKKKTFTLNRFVSCQLSFTPICLVPNPAHEEALAVTGVRDCLVLRINSTGTVADQLVLSPGLESGNHIVRPIWLPGSPTELALITADFIKIYNLSEDLISPIFYFLLPQGKIRDATFVVGTNSKRREILVMSNSGHIYHQTLSEEAAASNGPFFLTEVLETLDPNCASIGSGRAPGGVSLYYSHRLQLLFCSYMNGRWVSAVLDPDALLITKVFNIDVRLHTTVTGNSGGSGTTSASNSAGSNAGAKLGYMQLVLWSEVPNHPGLITATVDNTNNILLLSVEPDRISVQEITAPPGPKSRFVDNLTMRVGGRSFTLALSEDGVMRLYQFRPGAADYWLQPMFCVRSHLQNGHDSHLAPERPLKSLGTISARGKSKHGHANELPQIDFFEKCTVNNEVSFGGDLLQFYNHQQLKQRLTTNGRYVAVSKHGPANLEILNENSSFVMVGLTVGVGSSSLERVPQWLEVFGRRHNIAAIGRARVFDIPFTREESLSSDRRVVLSIGPSRDRTHHVSFIDSVRVWVQTKDAFGWPEEAVSGQGVGNTNPGQNVDSESSQTGINGDGGEAGGSYRYSLTDDEKGKRLSVTEAGQMAVDRLTTACLEGLAVGANVFSFGTGVNGESEEEAKAVATRLLAAPSPPQVSVQSERLLASLHAKRGDYLAHRDSCILTRAGEQLDRMVTGRRLASVAAEMMVDTPQDFDVEVYQELLGQIRRVAAARPQHLPRTEAVYKMLVQVFEERLLSWQPKVMAVAPIHRPVVTELESTVGALVEVLHTRLMSLMMEDKEEEEEVKWVSDTLARLLVHGDIQVSSACRAALCRLTKLPKPPAPPLPAKPTPVESSQKEEESLISTDTRQPSAQPPHPVMPPPGNSPAEPWIPVEGEGQGAQGAPAAPDVFHQMLDYEELDEESIMEIALAMSREEHEQQQQQQQQQPPPQQQQVDLLQQQVQQVEQQVNEQNDPILLEPHPGVDFEMLIEEPIDADEEDEDMDADEDDDDDDDDEFEDPNEIGQLEGGEGGEDVVDIILPADGQQIDDTNNSDQVPGRRSSSLGAPSAPGAPSGSVVPASDNSSRSVSPMSAAMMGAGASVESSTVSRLPPATGADLTSDAGRRLRMMRRIQLLLLRRLSTELKSISVADGQHAIPLLQVLLSLADDLDLSNEESEEVAAFLTLLRAFWSGIDSSVDRLCIRKAETEVALLLMRCLVICLSRDSQPAARFTSQLLLDGGCLELCHRLLRHIVGEHRAALLASSAGGSTEEASRVLRSPLPSLQLDFSPLVMRNYAKERARDMFVAFVPLLAEGALRLPYLLHKVRGADTRLFDVELWTRLLCELLNMDCPPPLRKAVRKLLVHISGTKERYRQVRDRHIFGHHINAARDLCRLGGLLDTEDLPTNLQLNYNQLIDLMEHLKACQEVASPRPPNWQSFCAASPSSDTLPFLFRTSVLLEEGVAQLVLHLLQASLPAPTKQSSKGSSSISNLADLVAERVPRPALRQFVRLYLCYNANVNIRKQAQQLLYAICKHTTRPNFDTDLLHVLNEVLPELPSFARKAVHFVDLIGYLVLFRDERLGKDAPRDEKITELVDQVVKLFQAQNLAMTSHANAQIYARLEGVVDVQGGYYLEAEPCLVCHELEQQCAMHKLNSLKADTKSTMTAQLYKLNGTYQISKIQLKLTDVRRSKSIKTLNIYYNNRTSLDLIALKTRPSAWIKVKKVSLQQGQTEVRVELPLPIVACHLMFEYADFYESSTPAGETLQCPRCSTSVPVNPGVCINCGENVFQCHKCRAINYDERDPFICNSCGYCKFAKFDYSLFAKPCFAVDPIETEDDRRKALNTVASLMERAARSHTKLAEHRTQIERQLAELTMGSSSDNQTAAQPRQSQAGSSGQSGTAGSGQAGSGGSGGSGGGGQSTTALAASTLAAINKSVQLAAHCYAVDCKKVFHELSNVNLRVLACRRELAEYDRRQMDLAQEMIRRCTEDPQLLAGGAMSRSVSVESGSYLQASSLRFSGPPSSSPIPTLAYSSSRCYGCAGHAVSRCLLLLRALASSERYRSLLHEGGLVEELVECNVRHARRPIRARSDIYVLLSALVKGNAAATHRMLDCIVGRVEALMKHLQGDIYNLGPAVTSLLSLLLYTLPLMDDLWEERVRAVMRLFITASTHYRDNNVVLETVAIPCLSRILDVIQQGKSETQPAGLRTVLAGREGEIFISLREWLSSAPNHSYASWLQLQMTQRSHLSAGGIGVGMSSRESGKPAADRRSGGRTDKSSKSAEKRKDTSGGVIGKETARKRYLEEKFGRRWRRICLQKVATRKKNPLAPRSLVLVTPITSNDGWLRRMLFAPGSPVTRRAVCKAVCSVCIDNEARIHWLLSLLVQAIPDVRIDGGEHAAQYVTLFSEFINQPAWRAFCVLRCGALSILCSQMEREVEQLVADEDGDQALHSVRAGQGLALKWLNDLLEVFLAVPEIRRAKKQLLVVTILNGFLGLKRLILTRNKTIDEVQEKLLKLLEELTTGTAGETRDFMSVCLGIAQRCLRSDLQSPAYIFERLCSIIKPEDPGVGEFAVVLEKDAAQEEFLSGRMAGNPYPGSSLGPSMRDVKNKICRDTELMTLIEDDTAMELLVDNKIISLDLPVEDVYRKVWLPRHADTEPMKVIYRLRGLLGDATEDMIESLSAGDGAGTEDTEMVYKMADVLAENGGTGLKVLLDRIACVRDLVLGRGLLTVSLKLLGYCLKLERNRRLMLTPSLQAIPTLLRAINIALTVGTETSGEDLSEEILSHMETILKEASVAPHADYHVFAKQTGDAEQLRLLLARIYSVRERPSVLQGLLRLVPFLAFGDAGKILTLIEYFEPYLDFSRFDKEHSDEEKFYLDCFCRLTGAIASDANGQKLKDLILEQKIVDKCSSYLHHRSAGNERSGPAWESFLEAASLPFVLRILTGVCDGHAASCRLAGLGSETIVPLLHSLEQVSATERNLGTLSESLLNTLSSGETLVGKKIADLREHTKQEKKRLAMANRQKALRALKMTTNAKGQVRVTSGGGLGAMTEGLKDETGLVCRICHEGYRNQPNSVLAIYTFSKKCALEEFEAKSRKTMGYSTVSSFTVIHLDCHLAAVRSARSRDEWESAYLQNGNVACNGLLPLYGPTTSEAAYTTSLARYNSYLQESVGIREPNYLYTVHDEKLLIMKFAKELSFSEDTQGGGRQSNLHLLPYLLQTALHVMLCTNSVLKEREAVRRCVDAVPGKWVLSSWEVDGPFYQATMAMHVCSLDEWVRDLRLNFLRQFIVVAHARRQCGVGASVLKSKTPLEFSTYRWAFLFFAMIDGIYTRVFQKVRISSGPAGGGASGWSEALMDFVRRNDTDVLAQCDALLRTLEEDLLPCQSFSEICDVIGLLGDPIPNPEEFLTQCL